MLVLQECYFILKLRLIFETAESSFITFSLRETAVSLLSLVTIFLNLASICGVILDAFFRFVMLVDFCAGGGNATAICDFFIISLLYMLFISITRSVTALLSYCHSQVVNYVFVVN